MDLVLFHSVYILGTLPRLITNVCMTPLMMNQVRKRLLKARYNKLDFDVAVAINDEQSYGSVSYSVN
jgi:hypothetical protein